MIHNLHILINPEPNHQVRALEVLQKLRIDEHRRGEHPWGEMRRDCPLCQLGK